MCLLKKKSRELGISVGHFNLLWQKENRVGHPSVVVRVVKDSFECRDSLGNCGLSTALYHGLRERVEDWPEIVVRQKCLADRREISPSVSEGSEVR
jgi:hypothetical protein